MIRDEADILPAFLDHVAHLFDFALVVDHSSVDGSASLLERAASEWPDLRIWRLAAPGYWQPAVMTALAHEAFGRGAEWVVPLDADEFLNVASRSSLEAALGATNSHVAFFRWWHAVTDDGVLEGREPLTWPLRRWLANPTSGKPGQGKVALHRRIVAAFPGFSLGAGNHRLIPCRFAKPQTGPDAGTMWHVPVRSRSQFIAKLRRDLLSHTGRGGRAIAGMASARQVKHALLDRLLANPDDTDMLRKVALGYWEFGVDCLSPKVDRPPPIEMAPNLALSERLTQSLSSVRADATQGAEPHADIDGASFAVARLADRDVVVEPGSAHQQFSSQAELWLERNFTPGFRLARFIASRWTEFRLSLHSGASR